MATTPLQEMGQNDGRHNLLRPAIASGFGIGDVTPEISMKGGVELLFESRWPIT